MATKKSNAKATTKAPKASKAKKVTRNSKKSEVEGHKMTPAKTDAKATKVSAKTE